jgi:lipoyl synthase
VLELPIQKQKKIAKPSWLKIDLPTGDNYKQVKKIVKENALHTICEDGKCPNMGECWGAGTATFMILGNVCTRSCGFCAVATGRPGAYDLDEPKRIAEAVSLMGVKHCVITSVNRDELKDKGSTVWANTIKEVKLSSPSTTLEVLIPDFKAEWDNLYLVLEQRPEVSHNMETVERLYRIVRPQAKYQRSLDQIKRTKEYGLRTKSGAMLALLQT